MNNTSTREKLVSMSTEQLDELLNWELSKEPVNDSAVRMIFSVLRERERDLTCEISPEMKASWETYCRNSQTVLNRGTHLKGAARWLARAASLAAVLAIAFLSIPKAADAGSIWDMISKFSSDVVEFFAPGDNEQHLINYAFTTENTGLQQVYDSVLTLGVDIPVVPMWIPDGYVLQECKTMDSPNKSGIVSSFRNGDQELIFKVDVYGNDAPHSYQKDETEVIVMELYGTAFHILKNNDVLVAIWTIDNIECSIFTKCQEDTLREILKSIYVLEDLK